MRETLRMSDKILITHSEKDTPINDEIEIIPVEYVEGHGYVSEGKPTDDQIKLQDTVDNSIVNAVETIISTYKGAITDPESIKDYEHDISKIGDVRELIEKLYDLPSVY